MAGKKRELTKKEIEEEKKRKRQHKLNSLRNEFNAGRIKSFEQVFAIMVESAVADELGLGFTTFRNRRSNPGEFTINDLIRFSELMAVDINIILQFVFGAMKYKSPVASTKP